MKMRNFFLIAAVVAMTGCASVKDVRDREPVFYGSTDKTAQEYVTCVANSWRALGVTSAQVPVRNGYELVVEGSVGVEAVLTATTWKGKTDARLSTRVPRYDQSMAEAANLCR